MSWMDEWKTSELLSLLNLYQFGQDWFANAAEALSKQFVDRPKNFFTPESCKREFDNILNKPHPEHYMEAFGERYSQRKLVLAWARYLKKVEDEEKKRENYMKVLKVGELVALYNRSITGDINDEEIQGYLESFKNDKKDNPEHEKHVKDIIGDLRNKLKLHEENPQAHPLPIIKLSSKDTCGEEEKEVEEIIVDDSTDVNTAVSPASEKICEATPSLPGSSPKQLRSSCSPKKTRAVSESSTKNSPEKAVVLPEDVIKTAATTPTPLLEVEKRVDEPVESEPIVSEPVESKPVENEPIESEPLEIEPVEIEPVENEPVENEPIVSEPIMSEPIMSEPILSEPVESEPDKAIVEPAKTVDDVTSAKSRSPSKVPPKRMMRGSTQVAKSNSLVSEHETVSIPSTTLEETSKVEKSTRRGRIEKNEKSEKSPSVSESAPSTRLTRKRRFGDSISTEELLSPVSGTRARKRRKLDVSKESSSKSHKIVVSMEKQSSPEQEVIKEDEKQERTRRKSDRHRGVKKIPDSIEKQQPDKPVVASPTNSPRKRSTTSTSKEKQPEKTKVSRQASVTSKAETTIARTPTGRRRTSRKSDLDEAAVEQRNLMVSAWRIISSHRHAGIFSHPVSQRDARDYTKIVKSPMDLSTLKKLVDSGRIREMVQFKHRLLLMFANAVMFNSTGHDVNNYAKEMSRDAFGSLKNNILYMRGGAHITRRSAAFASAETQPEKKKL